MRARNAKGAARRPLPGESDRVGGDPAGLSPSADRPWAGSLCVVVRHRGGGPGHEAHLYHLSPAPSERAIVARSDTATVKRARFAFTAATSVRCCVPALGLRQPGGLPRKIPGFASPSHAGFALDGRSDREANIAPPRTVPGGVPRRQATVVPVDRPARVSARRHRRSAAAARSRGGAASGRRDHQTTTPSGRSVVRATWPRARRLIGGTTWALAACTSTASRSSAAAGRPNR